MALITSTQSGNFNDPNTWTGGVVPVAGDEARASTGHTITINVNTTCDEVSNAGTGIFTLNDGITLTANVTSKSTTTSRTCLQFTANSPATATIIGNCTGGTVTGANAVVNTGTGTLTITGNCTGGSGTSSSAVNNTLGGTINITGNCTGGTAAVFRPDGVRNGGTGNMNITGNCTGGSNSTAASVTSCGAANDSTGSLTITGNCTGGSAVVADGARNHSTGTMTIIGNCTGGTSSTAGAINASTGTMIVNGSIFASETASGVSGPSRSQVTRLTGPFYTTATFGVNPIGCLAWRWDTSLVNTTFIEVPTQNLATKRNLVTPDNATNFPSASSVRSGTSYGISSTLSGTCVIPPAASVALGVPVDNTIGSANLTSLDFWNTLVSVMSTSGSIGARLKNASTISTTGQQLADALSS